MENSQLQHDISEKIYRLIIIHILGMSILITGGCGYIGSVVVHKLINLGYQVIIIDNLSRGDKLSLHPKAIFYECDIADQFTDKILTDHKIDAIMHFAAYAHVNESMEKPYEYYENNVLKTIEFLKYVVKHKIKKFIFSSTCATYGVYDEAIQENFQQNPINAYGATKLCIEQILNTLQYVGMQSICLRYFNVAGCYIYQNEKGDKVFVGENHDPETHLIPNVLKNNFKVYGSMDNARDYVHVEDLADAHILALKYSYHTEYNVGNGHPVTIREIIKIAEKVTNKKLEYEKLPARSGDPPILYCDPTLIKKHYLWNPKYNIEDIIKSTYEYEKWRNNEKYDKDIGLYSHL